MPLSIDFEALFSASPNPYVLLDKAFNIVAMNDAYLRVTESERRLIEGRNMFEAFPSDPRSDSQRLLKASLHRVLETGQKDHLPLIRYDLRLERGGFEERYWSATHTPVPDRAGDPAFILQHTVDVTELQRLRFLAREVTGAAPGALVEADVFRRAQEVQESNDALDQERLMLRGLFAQAPGFIAVLDGPDYVFTLANAAYHQIVDRDQILGKPVREALPEVADQGFVDLLDRVRTTGEPFVGRGVKVALSSQDGTVNERFVDFVYQPILNQNEQVSKIFVQGYDVTEQMQAEEALQQLNETLEARVVAEIAERQQTEAALQQAQKMEAIGKLTGGVAHDFNNLLQVISGNLQLLAKEIAGNERAERRVANALAGTSRGAKLASHLLAFGRRQPLEPKVINIGRLLYGMEDMLRRALGEAIETETIVSGGLWNTYVDPGQVENALLNLAINARDAMGGNGKLTIELGNAFLDDAYARSHVEVSSGQYVMLAVSDTGCGMAPEVLQQAFEPFFSTKAPGEGTGLGLAMVYGFIKQSGGHIKIYSEMGHGTTVKLYLPRSLQSEDEISLLTPGAALGGTETVLVAEDDEEVRATAVDMLSELGYRVFKAKDAASALAIIESGVPIDLLFTDVVMPGPLTSPELARKAKKRQPDIEVLFTSGYTENAIVHGGRLDEGVELLSKPYTHEMLARKVRHLLRNRDQREVAEHTPAQSGHSEAAAAPEESPSELRVLLVEDDPLIRMNTVEMLQDLGHSVTEVGSANEAMAALQSGPFDVVVTDVGLPGVSGIDFAVRARELAPGLPVVFATGADHVKDAGDGPTIHLRKPYSTSDLRSALADAHQSVPR